MTVMKKEVWRTAEPSHSKPRRWKSMLIHQGRFTALYTQRLLDSQSLEFEICIFPRKATPSHYHSEKTRWPGTFMGKATPVRKLSLSHRCHQKPSHSKPRRWKSMLIHQERFVALYTQHLLDSQSLELKFAYFQGRLPRHGSKG